MHLGYSYSEFAMPYSLSVVVPVLLFLQLVSNLWFRLLGFSLFVCWSSFNISEHLAFTTVGVNDCVHLLSPYQQENYQNSIQYVW